MFCCVGCRIAYAASGGTGDGQGLIEARLMFAAFLAMAIMTFSVALYGEDVYARGDEQGMTVVRTFGRVSLALFSLPVLALLVPPLLRGAVADIRRGVVRMDGLIVLAVSAAFIVSVHATVTDTGHVYFDTATMVLVLVTFGRRLEAHARTRGRDAAELLAECLPAEVPVLLPTGEELRQPRDLVPGDRIRIPPGARVGADVEVLEGRSEVAVAHLTGESAPIDVGAGDEVVAGATNGTGALVARVVRRADDGALGRIRRLLEAPVRGTEWTRVTDRLAGVLAFGSMSLALTAGAWFTLEEGLGAGISTALAVLLVACPCALGLATPLAYRAIRAALARRGALVSDPAALERLHTIDTVLLDKTGTLTDPESARFRTLAGDDELLERMESLVAASGHTLAAAARPGRTPPTDVRIVPGAGVAGRVEGRAARAGSLGWMESEGIEISDELRRAVEQRRGGSVVVYAEEGRAVAAAAVDHGFRDGTRDAVAALTSAGLHVEILSGDHPDEVRRAASELGVEGQGGLHPDDKLAVVRSRVAEGAHVLFLGDGVNDAPSLREAAVGVAAIGATETARAQVGVELLGRDLHALPALFEAGRELRRVVRGNFVWTLTYNGVALALAATGNLHPLVAVAAMIASSLVVSGRSYRLLELWKDEQTGAPT